MDNSSNRETTSSDSSDLNSEESNTSSSTDLLRDIEDINGYNIIPQNSLFIILKNQQQIERTIADNWLSWYGEEKYEAVAELLQLFVSTLGYEHIIRLPNNIAQFHIAFKQHLKLMELKFKQGQDYLLCNDNMQLYRDKYCNVLKKIIILGRDWVVYDDFLIKTVTDFLIELNKSLIVEHQHLSIITALSIFTPLTRLEANARFSVGQLDALRLEYLQQLLRDLYDGVVGRYMSSESDDVFKSCLTALIQWIANDQYGWRYCSKPHLSHLLEATTHSDRAVRLRALSTIRHLYETCANAKLIRDDRLESLQEFTKDSRHELLSICYMDIPRVCCLGIEVVKLAYGLFPDLFAESEIQSMCRLVFVRSQLLARSAGEFLWSYISKKHPGHRIPSLIVFYLINKSPRWDTGTLMDALWKQITSDVFREMVELLDRMLHTEYNVHDFIPHDESTILSNVTMEDSDLEIFIEVLLEFIVSYIRQASTGRTKRNRHTNKALSDLELLDIKLKTNKITEIFIDKIATFIETIQEYGVHCVALMLEVARYLNFELYIDKPDLMEELVVVLSKCLDEHDDRSILQECIHSIVSLRSSDVDSSLPVVLLLDDDVVGCYERFAELWKMVADSNMNAHRLCEEMLTNPEFSIEKSTTKICCLLRYVPIDCGQQFDQITNIIVQISAEYNVERYHQFIEFWKDCLRILYYYIVRQLDQLTSSEIGGMSYELDDVDNNRLNIILGMLFQIMLSVEMEWKLKILAYEELCDVLEICKYNSDTARTKFTLLDGFEDQIQGFWIFVENAVFPILDDREELAVSIKKRVLIFYFGLIWKKILPYEYFKVVTKHIRDHPELKKLVGEMVKSFRNIEKYNPHIKLRKMIYP